MTSIFLSYNKADKRFVRKLADRLIKNGIFVWLDERELAVGESLIEKISKAINRVDYIGAVLSCKSVCSSWVKKELQLATIKEIEGKTVTVLPILIEDCEIPAYLREKVYADFRHRHRFEKEFQKLLMTLKINPEQNRNLSEAGVSVEWTKEGPQVHGIGVSLSPLEWTALFNRYLEHFDRFCKQGTEHDKANVLAVIKSCEETYHTTLFEEDLKKLDSELGKKAELFFKHIITLWGDITKDNKEIHS